MDQLKSFFFFEVFLWFCDTEVHVLLCLDPQVIITLCKKLILSQYFTTPIQDQKVPVKKNFFFAVFCGSGLQSRHSGIIKNWSSCWSIQKWAKNQDQTRPYSTRVQICRSVHYCVIVHVYVLG